MRSLIPAQINGWKADGRDGVYDRKTLYDYIDGGAEVYLAYGFKQALARRFARPGHPAITVDLFDMGSSQDAYGVFSFEREGPDVGIGQDSEYGGGLLRFWKGAFFAAILADQETPASKRAVMALGKVVAQKIKPLGERPGILRFLPESGLIKTSVRFFHKKSGIDYHYFLADENILNLSERTNALLARYKLGETKAQLLITEYPEEVAAKQAFDSFVGAYMPEGRSAGVLQTENGKWVAAKALGARVVIIFDAPDEPSAENLIAEVRARTEGKAK